MKLNKNQKYFMINGGIWSFYDSCTVAFFALFALALGASNTTIGLISAIPYIAVILAEIPGVKLLEYFSRKKIVFYSLFSRLLWILLAIIPLIFDKPLLIILVVFFFIKFLDLISDPAWTSYIAQIIPPKMRGKYFSRRFLLIGLCGAIASSLAGLYLKIYGGIEILGFQTLFLIGAGFGLATIYFFNKTKEPDPVEINTHKFKDFFKFEGDYKKFCIYTMFFNFAYMLASPFFNVYMIKNLGLSYELFGFAVATSTITKIFVQKHFGKLTDKYGDKPINIITAVGTGIVPIMFFFTTADNWWMIFPAQIISGLVWAGYELTVFNLLLDFTKEENRSIQVAKYGIVTSIPMIIAPLLGGYLIDRSSTFFIAGIQLIFLISAGLRFITPLFLYNVKEPRIPHEYSLLKVLKNSFSIHPLQGINQRLGIAHFYKSKKEHIK